MGARVRELRRARRLTLDGLAAAYLFRRFTRFGAGAVGAGWPLLAGGVISAVAWGVVLASGGLASGHVLVLAITVPAFASTHAEPEILEIWQETMQTPCVAIGGIAVDNCAQLIEAGADFSDQYGSE